MSDCSWVLAQRAVDRRSHSAQGCTRGGTSDTHAPHLHAVDISADVAGSLSVITSGTRVLAVLQNLEVNLQLFRSEEHTSELQSRFDLVCRLLLEKKKNDIHVRIAARPHGS